MRPLRGLLDQHEHASVTVMLVEQPPEAAYRDPPLAGGNRTTPARADPSTDVPWLSRGGRGSASMGG
ncbi:hypothetical protein EDF22_2016 [Rathayibacter sp. PhB127]|nr:hypothetical protein EDF22_2016 [Rathayibacter sp. PhB127]